MIDLGVRASAVEGLAALVRSGLPVRDALTRWHEDCPESVSAELRRLSRRLRLGASLPEAIDALRGSFEEDAHGLIAVLVVHRDVGGDVARMLTGLARSIRERAEARSSAGASAAGARLSARVVAGLPLAFVPLTGVDGGRMTDPLGATLLVVGAALSLCGLLWIGRLLPRPPRCDDPVAMVADLVAGAVRGGCSLPVAFAVTADHPPPGLEVPLRRASRRVALGLTWTGALAREGDSGLADVAERLQQAHRFGLPVAGSLEALAGERRAASRTAFERDMRRSTVLMVIPLTLCVLPAFVLLAVVPFLRSLSFV